MIDNVQVLWKGYEFWFFERRFTMSKVPENELGFTDIRSCGYNELFNSLFGDSITEPYANLKVSLIQNVCGSMNIHFTNDSPDIKAEFSFDPRDYDDSCGQDEIYIHVTSDKNLIGGKSHETEDEVKSLFDLLPCRKG